MRHDPLTLPMPLAEAKLPLPASGEAELRREPCMGPLPLPVGARAEPRTSRDAAGDRPRKLRPSQVDHWISPAGAGRAKASLKRDVIAHSRAGAATTTVQVMPAL